MTSIAEHMNKIEWSEDLHFRWKVGHDEGHLPLMPVASRQPLNDPRETSMAAIAMV